jgi:galactonate dehydratase
MPDVTPTSFAFGRIASQANSERRIRYVLSRRRWLGNIAGAGALLGSSLRAADTRPLGNLKITRLELHKSTLRWRDLLFLEIHTDGGLVGIGEGSLHTRVPIVEEALRWLEPHLIGKDPAGVEDHWDRMYYGLTRWRNGPVIVTALSAVDIALWDLEGKRLGVPVWRLLGASPFPKLRAYFSHWDAVANARTAADYGRAAAEAKAKGWTGVKFGAVGGSSEYDRISQTVAKLAAIRQAVGEDFDIGLELGERLTGRSGLRFADAVEPYHPLFIEEATLRENPEAMTQLAAQSRVPLATGEGLQTRFEFRRLLEAKGASIIQPDVLHCGGITEIRRIARLGEVYGVEIAPHQCYGPVAHVASLHAMAGVRNFLIHEWEAEDDPLFQEATGGTYPVQQGGHITLPDRPGLGLTMDFAAFCRRHPFRSGARSMPDLKKSTPGATR